jgi:hypothetical protein
LWATCAGYNDILGEVFVADPDAGHEFTTTAVSAPVAEEATIYDLVLQVSPYVKACEDNMIRSALRAAAFKFFRDAPVWTETQTITVVTDTPGDGEQVAGTTFDLESDYTCITQRVLEVCIDDGSALDESLYEITEDEVLDFDDVTYAVGTVITIKKQIFPTLSCASYPSWVLNRWMDGIVAGTLMRLYAMADKPWSNPKAAESQSGEYRAAVARAHAERVQKRQSGTNQMVLRGGGLL